MDLNLHPSENSNECDSDGSTELQTHVERMESYRDKLYKSAKTSIVKSQKKQKQVYDQRRRIKKV